MPPAQTDEDTLEGLRAERARLWSELLAERAARRAAEDRREELVREADQLRELNEAYRTSLLRRATAPLRWLVRRVKRALA